MKTLILDGSEHGDPQAAKVQAALMQRLPQAEIIVLREHKIGNCAGDFFCWLHSPGMCNTNDDNRRIAAKIAQSDLLVYLTPVTFGGYSSELKRMVDHEIQNILPFFTKIEGQTHHKKRYGRYPDLLAIGWMAQVNPQAEAIFHSLVRRNALNMHAKNSQAVVLTGKQSQADLANQADDWLEALAQNHTAPAVKPPTSFTADANPAPTRRAVLLVGSPKTRKSTSASLGGYLMAQLEKRGIETETIQIYTNFNSPTRTARTLEKIGAADLVVLAFPLYVDSLPAPTTAALETIARHSTGRSDERRFVAIANCGFPEAVHNDTALAICAQFARESGYTWLGSLSLGGGQGIVNGVPLEDLGGRAAQIRAALDMTAQALAEGEAIPQAARELLAKPVIPNWLYVLMGQIGWSMQARSHSMHGQVGARPYERG
jgi:multimeric flavodoxin WrbA